MSSPGETRSVRTRELVAALLADGLSVAQIARVPGLTKSTVCYHKRGLGHEVDAKLNRRYDWNEVQRFSTLVTPSRNARSISGLPAKTFYDALKRGDVATRAQAAPIETYLVAGRRVGRDHLTARLL